MKRHISIFTFLLGAFAAVVPADPLLAAQTVDAAGYWKPGDPTDFDHWEQDSDQSILEKPNFFVNSFVVKRENLQPGWAVSNWLYSTDGFMSNPSPIAQSDGRLSYDWTGEEDPRPNQQFYIAVRFKHLVYNVKYDGNGAASPAERRNVLYTDRFNLAAAPKLTGCTFGGWLATPVGKTFGAGASVGGADLCPATWHEDKSNVTMVAQWTTNAYAVICDLGNGAWPTGYAPPSEVFYEQTFSLSVPNRTGYDFTGWKVTAGLDSVTAKWGEDKDPSFPVTADTLCVNGDKEVYFKNLNPTNGAAVTLTAQWRAKTITVTFNNTGGSSGGGLLDSLDVTYDAAYPALNVPSKGGNLFRGYEIDGVQYWDTTGQPTKVIWDIPSNCTAVAQWEKLAYQLTYNENRSDGTVSKTVVRDFEYGVPTVLYDGAEFSNLGCTLLGWSTDPNALAPSYGPGGTATFTESKTLYAVWEKNYFIAYDGNGATNETSMAVQKFVFGKANQSLNPNAYGKIGYSFLGWATNRVAAQRLDWTYEDRQILKDDLANTLGETNTLYATWEANAYCIAYDPNGGTGAAMPVTLCRYDQPVKLSESTYSRDIHSFVGWSNDVAKVVYTNLSESVSNLCSVANGTNTLYAIWKSAIGPLSEAMGCDNLKWESVSVDGKWIPGTTDWTNGGGTVSCALSVPGNQYALMQTKNTLTNGTLRFWWKSTGGTQSVVWRFGEKRGNLILEETDGQWREVVTNLSFSGEIDTNYIQIQHQYGNSEDACYIAKLTWTPEGSHPEPVDGKDNVTISSAAVADGKFTLSFQSDEKFDYNLLTNANLLIKEGWGVMEKKTGTGEPITFKPPIIEGQPQMFYKVETIKKK